MKEQSIYFSVYSKASYHQQVIQLGLCCIIASSALTTRRIEISPASDTAGAMLHYRQLSPNYPEDLDQRISRDFLQVKPLPFPLYSSLLYGCNCSPGYCMVHTKCEIQYMLHCCTCAEERKKNTVPIIKIFACIAIKNH